MNWEKILFELLKLKKLSAICFFGGDVCFVIRVFKLLEVESPKLSFLSRKGSISSCLGF